MDYESVKRVAIVGAGTMGHSIAQVFATADIDVHLVDADEEILTHALELMRSNLETMAECRVIEAGRITGILDRVHPFVNLAAALHGIPFVLEAVPEVPAIKEQVLARIVEHAPENAIIASNTSGLDIFKLAPLQALERTVIAHWFVPAHIIPLVEVVPGPGTLPEAVAFTKGLVEKIGKQAAVMKKFVPLFLVNRIQKVIVQAVYEVIANDWATPEEIDLAVKLCLGVRLPVVGVVQTLDFNGLDTVLALNRRDGMSLPLIEERVKDGLLGVKTSKGIYDYGGRSEAQILKKRDKMLLEMLEHLNGIGAFEPI